MKLPLRTSGNTSTPLARATSSLDCGEAASSVVNVALAALVIDSRFSDDVAVFLGVLVVQPANSRPATPMVAAARPTRRRTGKVSNMELSFIVVFH
ncbi:hypothetical protein G6F57_020071 [Rhizopus arrhizus]|nr:hypothetical protein G6F57_020071 [Rhizopus arrhizus]